MRHLQKIFSILLLISFGNIAYGQSISRSVIGAAGETLSNSSASITYTVGETVAETLSNPDANKYLTIGFNQPDIDIKTVLDQNISKSIVLFPNPVAGGVVKVAFNNVPDGVYTIDLIDASGKILQSMSVSFSSDNLLYVPIDVSQLKSGVYFIKVVNNLNFQGEVKLIKI
jgi:hypothetical protein